MSYSGYFDMLSRSYHKSRDILLGELQKNLSFESVVKPTDYTDDPEMNLEIQPNFKPCSDESEPNDFKPGLFNHLTREEKEKLFKDSSKIIVILTEKREDIISTSMWVPYYPINDSASNQKTFIKIVSELAEVIKPEFGYYHISTSGGFEITLSVENDRKIVEETTLKPYINELGEHLANWLYILGPSFVKKYGEKDLIGLPAEKKIKLKYGGMLIQLYNYAVRFEEIAKERSDSFKQLLLSKEK